MKLKLTIFALLFFGLCFAQDSASVSNSTGVLYVQSSVPAGVWVNGEAVGATPFSIELPVGWAVYSVRAPGYWTEVFLVDIKPGSSNSQMVQLKEFHLPTWGLVDVSKETDMRNLEAIYDSIAAATPVSTPDSICLAGFVQDYPLPHLAEEPLNQASPEYRVYYDTYASEKNLSFYEYYAGCTVPVQKNLDETMARINKLGNEQRLSGHVPVLGARFEPTTQDGLNGNLILLFRSNDTRADVAWQGTWSHDFLPGDELVKALTAENPSAMSFLTVQNQTLWIPVENGYSRHYYKYQELNISYNGLLIPMNGEFILPDYILAHLPQPTEIPAPVPEIVPEEVPLDTPTVAIASTAIIPAGKLTRKGKEIEIRTFKINTTAISQNVYKEACNAKKDFGKFIGDSIPAHSVTWDEANSCCLALGGDLPTEVEWEYAARAGLAHDYAWNEQSAAADYAIYSEKKPVKVATKKPNGWGLYDTFGNVAEWVKDDGFWFGKYKYLKGGSYKSKKQKDLKFEKHEEEDARYWGTHVGFRCVFRD